ncbi:MAG: uroporphyrinogen-III synthase [Gammaproteobacteria bacterium]|nr:uroporphyrinogen-III synthase [Gammaproteobacteria bacterium]MYC25336.1 uroporphyrinogen-III synthase [Gammaproteobacteria bacterium]
MAKRIWITRTEPGASRLAAKLLESGYQPITAPVFEIDRVESSTPQLDTDLWVFVSTHAVSHAANRPWDKTKPVIAVGPATATQLESLTVRPLVPNRHSSEGIYDLIRKRFQTGVCVTIVSGRDGRKDLADWLRGDGYVCHEWIVYERKPTKLHVQASHFDAIVIASGAAITEVREQFATLPSVSIPVVVPSPRDAELAKSQQFSTVLLAEGASDDAIVNSLEDLFSTRGQHRRYSH